MSENDALQLQWQQRLDRDFPHGLIMTWQGESWNYTVPYITVTGMAGLDPMLAWPVYAVDKVFHLTLASYTVTQQTPHLLVTASFTDEPRKMLWCAKLSPRMAALMDAERGDRVVT